MSSVFDETADPDTLSEASGGTAGVPPQQAEAPSGGGPGLEGQPGPSLDLDPQIFTLCALVLFEFVEARLVKTRGKEWKADDSERLAIGKAGGAVMKKYLDEILGSLPPEETALLFAVGLYAAPRLMAKPAGASAAPVIDVTATSTGVPTP